MIIMTHKIYFLILESLISTITSFVKAHNFNRIVLSLCGGRGETECQAKSDDLVVCLDSDRRSLFTGKFMARLMTGIKKNVIFSLFDYSHELFDFVRLVQLASNLPVILLFQHPSPSADEKSRKALQKAVYDSAKSLQLGYSSSIYFVFDCNSTVGKNTWSYLTLTNFVTRSIRSLLSESVSFVISDEETLASPSDNEVDHLIFGKIDKLGWALKKSGGSEVGFSLKKKMIGPST